MGQQSRLQKGCIVYFDHHADRLGAWRRCQPIATIYKNTLAQGSSLDAI